jgi:hypothetical protein
MLLEPGGRRIGQIDDTGCIFIEERVVVQEEEM